ncbi:hypothetical protein THTE_2053 [Thermogutta terrifontis]|uniref:Uncharacterized protein n=1 Tax=Thermogutta terrifontis TaxID=1331910 RepID=A0A286RFB3_9BACT|nr:hypothetical protein THTE_2053 [Thermogutta terrifontis]
MISGHDRVIEFRVIAHGPLRVAVGQKSSCGQQSESDQPDLSGLASNPAGQCSPQLPGASNINRFASRLPRVVGSPPAIRHRLEAERLWRHFAITHTRRVHVVLPC